MSATLREGLLPKPAAGFRPVSRTTVVILTAASSFTAVLFAFLQGVILVPLYLRSFSMVAYGAWLASSQLQSWFSMLDPGFADLTRQEVAASVGERNAGRLAIALGNGLALGVVVAVLPTIIAIALIPPSLAYLHLPLPLKAEIAICLSLGALNTGVTLLAFVVMAVLQGLQRVLALGIVQIAGALLGILTTIAAISLGLGIRSIALGLLARSIVWLLGSAALLAVLVTTHQAPVPAIDVSHWTRFARLSGYTFLSRIGQLLLQGTDSLLIGGMVNSSEAARFVLTGRATDTAKMCSDRLTSAFPGSLAHLHGSGNVQKYRATSLRLLGATLSILLLAGVGVPLFNAPFMHLWLKGTVACDPHLTIILAIAALTTGVVGVINTLMYAEGRIRASALALFSVGVIKVALSVLLVTRIGLVGIPAATAISCLVVGAIYYRSYVKQILFETHSGALSRSRSALAPIAALVPATAVALSTPSPTSWAMFSLQVLVFLLLACCTWAWVDSNLRHEIHGAIRTVARRAIVPR